jgi:hypothetical protein
MNVKDNLLTLIRVMIAYVLGDENCQHSNNKIITRNEFFIDGNKILLLWVQYYKGQFLVKQFRTIQSSRDDEPKFSTIMSPHQFPIEKLQNKKN